MKPETYKIRLVAVAAVLLSWVAVANVPPPAEQLYASDSARDRLADPTAMDAKLAPQGALEQGLLLPSRSDSERKTQSTVDRVKSATEIVEAAQARTLGTSKPPRAYWLVWIAGVWALLAWLSCGWTLREAAEHRHST